MLNAIAFLSNIAAPDVFVLVALAAFILNIFAIVEILRSPADVATKLLWFLVVWFVPWVGLILYYTIGRKSFKSV